jgi:hypothetical protein
MSVEEDKQLIEKHLDQSLKEPAEALNRLVKLAEVGQKIKDAERRCNCGGTYYVGISYTYSCNRTWCGI